MNGKLTGVLIQVDPTVEVSATFKKREFIVEEENEKDPKYNDYHKFQLVNDKCDKIELSDVGRKVTVDFNLKGRKWEKDGKTNYFTTLDAWKIELQDRIFTQQAQQSDLPTETTGDLPF